MVRPRTVSQWGPNAQGVRSRPDRSVSLRDVRDLPVQTMGFDFDEFDRLISEGTSGAERNPWDLVEDPKTGKLVERSELGRGSGGRVERLTDSELDSESRIQRGARLFRQGRYEEAYDVAEEIAEDVRNRGAHGVTAEGVMVDIEIQAQHIDRLEEEDLAEAEVLDEMAQEGAAGAEMQGLTADEAFRQHHAMAGPGSGGPDSVPGWGQGEGLPPPESDWWRQKDPEWLAEHWDKKRPWESIRDWLERTDEGEMRGMPSPGSPMHAMAGGEPPREGRAHPERAPAPYEPAPPMSEEQKKINRKGIEDARRRLNPNSQMAGPDWDAIEEGDYGAGNWWDTVPGVDDLGDTLPDPDEPLNPELRSMDSQMLADMMVAQPEQGYFGGLGDAVQGLTNRVAGMSGMERAALISALIAAGLITVGSGGMLTPVGVGLAGGAGLTALSQ